MTNDLEGKERARVLERARSGLSLATEIVRVPAEAIYQALLINAELIGGGPLGSLSYTHAMARGASQRIGRECNTLCYGLK